MLASNALTLRAVWITPSLRIKAYALTISMVVSNLMLATVVVSWIVRDIISPKPCGLKLYKAALRPIQRWIIYSSYAHVSFIAVDRYIAVKYALQYESRVTQSMSRHENVQRLL